MNKILKKISAVVQLVLLAPVKLPGKALHIIKYVALGLGVLEAVIGDGSDSSDTVTRGKSDERDDSSDKVDKLDRDELAEGEP